MTLAVKERAFWQSVNEFIGLDYKYQFGVSTAMATGVTDRIWVIEEIVSMAD